MPMLIKNLIAEIKKFLNITGSEPVNLENALGRVVANDVRARSIVPPYDISNCDGYAVKVEDLNNLPMTFTRVGKSKPNNIFNKTIISGETVEIFSGAPIPKGADTVISLDNVSIYKNKIVVDKFFVKGSNITPAGLDINSGDIFLARGTIIASTHIALAKLTDTEWLPVIKKPRIGIITNMGANSNNTQFTSIQSKNGKSVVAFLSAFINARGAKATNLGSTIGPCADASQVLAFKNEIKDALNSVDILVTIGGLKNINDNILWVTLMQQGAKLKSVNIAIGEGENLVIGNKDNIPIIGLPDNHTAALLTTLIFFRPIMDIMLGITDGEKNHLFALLDRDLDVFDKSRDYLYALVKKNDRGENIVSPVSAQDSLMISALSQTNCIIIVDAKAELKAGTPVEIILFLGSLFST